MKTVTVTGIALIASVIYPASAYVQVAKELEPSLQILQVVSTPMPDFRGVTFYQALPDSQGGLVRGIGHSDWVKGWFLQMEPMIPKFASLDERLRVDVDVYGDTIREEGEKVLDATADLKKQLKDLDSATVGRVQDLLDDYNREVTAARTARAQFNAASKDAENANYLVSATDAGAKECNLLLQRTKLEAKKAALLEEMQKGAAFLNTIEKALASLAGGPQGLASYLAGEAATLTREGAKQIILETIYAGTREQLYDIGTKIEAIDKSLQDIKCKQQEASLKAAKANLEARLIQVVVAFEKIVEHRASAWRDVDKLGTLKDPRSARTVPFFGCLQTYNAQVNQMGRKVFDSLEAYLEFLSRDPLARGELVLTYVGEDIRTVERERRDASGNWTSRARETQDYLDRYAKWYRGELTRGQKVIADLREGKHLDFVDKMMGKAIRELGGTVSYDDIIR